MDFRVDDYFKEEYLTCGRTRDNFIFLNCPQEFVYFANERLKQHANSKKSCCVLIDKKLKAKVEQILKKCKNELQTKIVARDFICTLILKQVLKGEEKAVERFLELKDGMSTFLDGDFDKYKENHHLYPFPLEITSAIKKYGDIELNIFLIDMQNIVLQQAINNFISSREPYSVKMFTTDDRLSTYLDQMGNRIEWPHDYMSVDMIKNVKLEDENESE